MELRDLLRAAEASRKARDFQAAVTSYLRVLEIAPDHLAALEGLADAFRAQKRWGLCLQTWERYLALRPDDASVQARVGDACRSMGNRARAETHYLAALRRDSRNRYALRGLGDLYQREERTIEALACWERLLEVDPGLVAIRAMAGDLCQKRRDFSRAEHHFREVLRADPDHPHAAFGLAEALRGQQRFREASGLWERMLQVDPRNRKVLCRAGDCFARLGWLDRAGALYGQALAQGYDRSALLGLARIHIARGDAGGASRCCQSILAQNPADTRAAQALDRIGRARAAGLRPDS